MKCCVSHKTVKLHSFIYRRIYKLCIYTHWLSGEWIKIDCCVIDGQKQQEWVYDYIWWWSEMETV